MVYSRRFFFLTFPALQNADALYSLGALQLMLPLLQDGMSSVRCAALLSLGRLVNVSEQWARDIVTIRSDVIPGLCKALRYALMPLLPSSMFTASGQDSTRALISSDKSTHPDHPLLLIRVRYSSSSSPSPIPCSVVATAIIAALPHSS